MEQIRKSIEVVAAVLVRDGKFLATQRGYGEFPEERWSRAKAMRRP